MLPMSNNADQFVQSSSNGTGGSDTETTFKTFSFQCEIHCVDTRPCFNFSQTDIISGVRLEINELGFLSLSNKKVKVTVKIGRVRVA